MAGIAHCGVGLAAKRFAPKVRLGVLLLGAYAIDVVFVVFRLAGIEHLPKTGLVTTAPYSHGLFMSVIWSAIAALITALISRNFRISVVIGLFVFSYWVVDFIAKPMRFVFPTDSGLPLLFDGSPTVGLSLWSSQIGAYVGEFATLILGIVIYILTLRKLRKEKRLLAREYDTCFVSRIVRVDPYRVRRQIPVGVDARCSAYAVSRGEFLASTARWAHTSSRRNSFGDSLRKLNSPGAPSARS